MSSMYELIEELWRLERNLVSDDYDRALYRLADEIASTTDNQMTIHEYPTGKTCWTWKIPEKWTCHEAFLETLDGQRLIDFKDHPLHVVSYSLPFEGIVTRDVLLDHLHTNPKLPEAIPFIFKYYQRDWGLCAPQRLKESLTDEAYRVVIRTEFESGTLKVGEVVIPGESDTTFILAAHLCHPAMVNDDLSGVVVGLDAAREMLAGPKPHYTYRLLILPETIGSVAYLSHNEWLIPKMVGGLFLEMLGSNLPHSLQISFEASSQVDRCFTRAIKSLDPNSYHAPYRQVINNDERQFNAPGVRVPMLSLSRVERRESPTWPYPQYHTSLDTPEIVTPERLEDSKRVLLGLLSAWEHNQYIVNNFKGEVFCSGYGIWVDYHENPEGHRLLFEIMERCDGEHTVADIASDLRTSFDSVLEVVKQFQEKGLVWFSRVPHSTRPIRKALL